MTDDPFAPFGSDDDDEDESISSNEELPSVSHAASSGSRRSRGNENRMASSLLAQNLLKWDPSLPLSNRRILLWFPPGRQADEETSWKKALAEKQMSNVEVFSGSSDKLTCSTSTSTLGLFDAVIACSSLCPATQSQSSGNSDKDIAIDPPDVLLPGGWFLYEKEQPTGWMARTRKGPIRVAVETCPWLSRTSLDTEHEERLVQQATTALSVHERTTGQLTTHSIRRAVQSLKQNGYAIVAGLLDAEKERCLEFGEAVLQDLHSAAKILKDRDQIDLYDPSASKAEPKAYRELSMREDYRMDVRDGPALRSLRARYSADGNRRVKIKASNRELTGDFLRGNRNILEIARRAMNPSDPSLAPGNFGRYNFDGTGPDGSFQDLSAGVLGGIVSLPHAAEQAVHADTPHLFEHVADPPLPPHYINVFTPGCQAVPYVGPTAFIHGSHRLDVVARYVGNEGNDNSMLSSPLQQFDSSIWRQLVRPVLNVGDVLLFDCRILHFGLANAHESIERPLLYTNLTQHWFHDPKNWSDEESVFDD